MMTLSRGFCMGTTPALRRPDCLVSKKHRLGLALLVAHRLQDTAAPRRVTWPLRVKDLKQAGILWRTNFSPCGRRKKIAFAETTHRQFASEQTQLLAAALRPRE